jgi:hypothetical protein
VAPLARPRVFIQKMAAVTHCGPSVVAFRNRNSATLAVALGDTEVEFIAVVFAQGLRIDADDARDVELGNGIGGKRLDLAATALVGFIRPSLFERSILKSARFFSMSAPRPSKIRWRKA